MINVQDVLRHIPHFEKFCSVEKLHVLVEQLRGDARFAIDQAGVSENGVPIYHLRFGAGSVKVLVIGFPHPNEPIGGLTVFSLLTLLQQGNTDLVNADVEWHIVPCIDPQGAMLNEGWSQQPFTLRNYLKHFHRQVPRDQVEASFPIRYKRLAFDEPTNEAKILKALLDEIRPDFFFSLHNTHTGGAYYCLTRALDEKYYGQLYRLLEQHRIKLQQTPYLGEWCHRFADGIREPFISKNFYDFLEKTTSSPERVLRFGAISWEYLAEIYPDATTFLTELPYVTYPSEESKVETGLSLRQYKLRIDADNKYLITVILEEWDRVRDDLDSRSPFYRKIMSGIVSERESLAEGLPIFAYKTRDILLNPAYAGAMSEGERFNTFLMERFLLLCNSYEFVRLLQVSAQTPAVSKALTRVEREFEEGLEDFERQFDASAFKEIDCDTLARVQLGSGLIVLNAILEEKSASRERV